MISLVLSTSRLSLATNYVEKTPDHIIQATMFGCQNSESVERTVTQIDELLLTNDSEEGPAMALLDFQDVGSSSKNARCKVLGWMRDAKYDKMAVVGYGISGGFAVWMTRLVSGKNVRYFRNRESATEWLRESAQA